MSVESAFQSVLDRVHQGQRATAVSGLLGLGIAHTTWRLSRKKPVVFVCRSGQLDDAVRDLRFFAGPQTASRILGLPADERTPYHATSPDPLRGYTS